MTTCEPCERSGQPGVPATDAYQMALVPAPQGVIPICARHVPSMGRWLGKTRPLDLTPEGEDATW